MKLLKVNKQLKKNKNENKSTLTYTEFFIPLFTKFNQLPQWPITFQKFGSQKKKRKKEKEKENKFTVPLKKLHSKNS